MNMGPVLYIDAFNIDDTATLKDPTLFRCYPNFYYQLSEFLRSHN